MIRITELSLALDAKEEELKKRAARLLGVPCGDLGEMRICKKSVDARKKDDIRFVYTADFAVNGEERILKKNRDRRVSKSVFEEYTVLQCDPCRNPPAVIGFGPAGMFCALVLAQAGLRPVVFERGSDVDTRNRKVSLLQQEGLLDPECNVQFGEGGAGTFSDGKLNTGISDSRIRKVLSELVKAGAPEEILYEAKPHVGTDRLSGAVANLRKTIESLGGKVIFDTRLTGIEFRNGSVFKIRLSGKEVSFDTETVILAIGHSARDTFEMLSASGFSMEAKAFSVGARIEQKQEKINLAQYGKFASHPALGAADYKQSVHLENGRGVYTFCMCPGGSVIAAASEENAVVTNGMSLFRRDGENANSALLVGVTPEDFGTAPLAGVAFQREIEKRAYLAGGGGYRAPAQTAADFLDGRRSDSFCGVIPSYLPGVVPSELDAVLPHFVTDAMRQGMRLIERRLPGFCDAVLTGPETRSSSPVRILRDERMTAEGKDGVYPCGEGAGYAGGIVSAAVDGIKCAEKVIDKFRR